MQFFIGIVPPEPVIEAISQFQKSWPNNRIGSVAEPHITIKAQGGLTEDLGWAEKLKAACASFPQFRLALGEPGSFGDDVVYLSVQSEAIYDLHRLVVQVIAPSPEQIDRYFELQHYFPHLTLGQTEWGMKKEQLADMKHAANVVLAPFPAWTVTRLRIYKETAPDRYVPYADIPLGKA